MPDPKPKKPRTLRVVLALMGVALVLLVALSWANRRTLARDALTGWLHDKGIASQAEVEAVGPTSFVGRLQVGDPRNPDFDAERVEVRYRPTLSGVQVISVTLRKPVLRASYRGGRLGVGALDPLVKEFLARPPQPDVRAPRIAIDDGVLVLATDYGPARLTADAVVDDGKLQTLTATSAPMRLRGDGFDVAVGQGSLKAVTRAGRVDLALGAPVAGTLGAAVMRDGRASLTAQFPYPDLQKRRGDGALIARAGLTAAHLDVAGQQLDKANLSAALSGQLRGWITDLDVNGQTSASLRADSAKVGGQGARVLQASATASDFRWTRKGGDRVAATVRLIGGFEGLDAGDLRLSALTATASGRVAADRAGVTADLAGSAVGRGGWSGLGGVTAADQGDMAAIKRAARSFRLAAPAFTVRLKDGVALSLPKALRLVPDSGGAVEITTVGAGYRLTSAGGGLPRATADVARFDVANGAATATGRVRAQTSLGFVVGGDVDASGRVRIADGGLTFTGDRCAAFKAARLEFGANDVEALSGRLCAATATFKGGDWRLAGRVEGAAASVPFLQARVDGGAGAMTATSRGGRVALRAPAVAARLSDTAPQPRFNPLQMAGDVTLSNNLWKARLTAKTPAGVAIGRANLTHDMGLGIGFVVLNTDTLTFAEGGLQPAQLSPTTATIGSPVTGSAVFTGRFDWAGLGAGSSGTLTIPRLDFQSAAGPVKGLAGKIEFTSLAPLVAAPGQELTIEEVGAIVPLTALKARFALVENLLKIEGGEAVVGGGKVRVEKLEYPLVPGAPTRGVLFAEGVQLHDLVEASPFGDKVDLDAKVSGRIVFEANDNKVRITEGELTAIQPGRISIDRTALTGVQADGAVTGPVAPAVVDPNATFTDFAYQAMEHLAFEKLTATIASRNDGRLGVLFQIVGRHDPPQKQRIKLTIMDLIQQKFLGRTLPLPSGTQVNLTLDTSLNLDDLLADYAEYRRLHGSGPVQP